MVVVVVVVGCCKGKAHVCDIEDDNTGVTANQCAEKP